MQKYRNGSTIAYMPTILSSKKAIAGVFGVSVKTVNKWIQLGAPIAVEGDASGARYSAEIAALQEWRLGIFHHDSKGAE